MVFPGLRMDKIKFIVKETNVLRLTTANKNHISYYALPVTEL